MPHPEVMPAETQDWRPWLDHELSRLPDNYRAVIVACDLEGLSRKEAARLLGLAEGTVSSRLARGRRLLANRLTKHGFSLSGGVLALALSEGASAAVPVSLVSSTVKTVLLLAAGQLAADMPAAVLMKGVLKTMFVTKLKLAISVVMVVTVLGASGLVYRAAGQPAPAEKRADTKPRTELEKLRRENELLKLNLEVVLEKVRAQETELRALKTQVEQVRSAAFSPDSGELVTETRSSVSGQLRIWDRATGKELDGKAALKALGDAREKKDILRAVGELESALEKLRQQLKKDVFTQEEKEMLSAVGELERALEKQRQQLKKPAGDTLPRKK